MTAQSIVCAGCAAEVPYGRLSCPSCGELLASVAGSRRAAAPAAARTAVPDVLYEPPHAPSPAVVEGQLASADVPRDVEAELPWAETTTKAAGEADVNVGGHTTSSMAVPFGTAASLNGSRTPAYMPRPGSRRTAPQPVAPAPEDEPMPAPLFDPDRSVDPVPAAAPTVPSAPVAAVESPAWPVPAWPTPAAPAAARPACRPRPLPPDGRAGCRPHRRAARGADPGPACARRAGVRGARGLRPTDARRRGPGRYARTCPRMGRSHE
jgi:hypothetical protein